MKKLIHHSWTAQTTTTTTTSRTSHHQSDSIMATEHNDTNQPTTMAVVARTTTTTTTIDNNNNNNNMIQQQLQLQQQQQQQQQSQSSFFFQQKHYDPTTATTTTTTNTMMKEDEEITRNDALQFLFLNKELSDLILRGLDGMLVVANKCLLASRSPVFYRMFYGPFKEAVTTATATSFNRKASSSSSPPQQEEVAIIDVGYDGIILQTIVEYILTDNISISFPYFEKRKKIAATTTTPPTTAMNDGSSSTCSSNKGTSSSPSSSSSLWDRNIVQLVVMIIDAANYFALPGLRSKMEHEAKEVMEKNDDVAALFLAVCTPENHTNNKNDKNGNENNDCDDGDCSSRGSENNNPTTITTTSSTSTTKFLQESALQLVTQYPTIITHVNPNIIAQIHPLHIETILKQYRPREEHSCFQILQSWANATTTTTTTNTEVEVYEDDNNNDDGRCFNVTEETSNDSSSSSSSKIVNRKRNVSKLNQPQEQQPSRKEIAAQMTCYIHLEDIDIDDLSTTVSKSGLVTTKQLCDAYQIQAFRTRKKLRTVYQSRQRPIWKSSKSTILDYSAGRYGLRTITDIIDCSPMVTSGIYKWSIKVQNCNSDLELGVISTKYWPFSFGSDEGLSSGQGGWALSADGYAMHAIDHPDDEFFQSKFPRFTNGSTVSFTLELVDGEEGILSASIDGNIPFELFSGENSMKLSGGSGGGRGKGRGRGESNYHHRPEEDSNDGFVPAVCISLEGCVEFLGFEHEEEE